MEEEVEENLIESLRLPPKKEKAAGLIADGVSQRKTAQVVLSTPQTINTWCKEEDFKRRVDELRTDISKQLDEILNGGARRAAQTVVDLAAGSLQYEDAKELNSRLRAALFILGRFKSPKLNKSTTPGRRSERDATTEGDLMDAEEVQELLDR